MLPCLSFGVGQAVLLKPLLEPNLIPLRWEKQREAFSNGFSERKHVGKQEAVLAFGGLNGEDVQKWRVSV